MSTTTLKESMLMELVTFAPFVQSFVKPQMHWTCTCRSTINKQKIASGLLLIKLNKIKLLPVSKSLNFVGTILVGDQNEQNDQLVRSKMVKLETCWSCTDCIFQGHGKSMSESLNNTYRHIETNHVSVSFMCVICYKQCKNRSTLLLHRSRYHRNK